MEGVTLQFGGITALDDVRFAVAPGIVHALIGPNGAGKSSCFNVISGLYRPTMGAVRFGDRLTHVEARAPAGRARHRPLVPEHRAVPGLHRAGQRAARPARADQRRVPVRRPAAAVAARSGGTRPGSAEICAFLGIADRLDDPVGALPYGVAKRVDIARALAVEPTLLLLDEPAAGLNAVETAEMA